MKNTVSIGAALSGLGIILGAFGTHSLQGKIGYDLLDIYKTASYYLIIHALALILFGLSKIERRWPAWCFIVGIVIFCGSLYGITFTGVRELGMITPIGGLAFISGWVGFAYTARTLLK